MGGQRTAHRVRQLSAHDADYLPAIHIALGAQPTGRGDAVEAVVDLQAAADRQAVTPLLVFGGYRGRRLEGAVVAYDGGGSSALVYVPRQQPSASKRTAVSDCLLALRAECKVREIKILESLLESDAHDAARSLEGAGFRYLTRLVYLSRQIPGQQVDVQVADDVQWLSYTPEREELFCGALDASYAESLDCPELTGLRTAEDILAGHRASGLFDPTHWWVVTRESQPVGVLLLCGVPGRAAFEIAYIGVAQTVRGKGVANALVKRAIEAVRSANAVTLTLAVDRRNLPARRLYQRWFFRPVAMRDAWVASSHPA